MKKFTIHGARGSIPVSGKQFLKYGGATTCFSLETKSGILVIDAGSGMVNLSDKLAGRRVLPPITVLFTHFHQDHLIGLPFFGPLYRKDAQITFMGDASRKSSWRKSLTSIVAPPYWPLALDKLPAAKAFIDIKSSHARFTKHTLQIQSCPLRHPQGCLAYRINTGLGVIVIATDHEHGHPEFDKPLLKLCRDADYLISDAQYTEREYTTKTGWGHGVWRSAVSIAEQAGVKHLILTHHDRRRTDKQIDKMVRTARQFFPNTIAARTGMNLTGDRGQETGDRAAENQ